MKLDPATRPDDAQCKGYQPVIVQDILLSSETIRFLKEKYYSPSQEQTFLAPLPPGYDGQFGPNVKALVLTLYYESGVSMPKIQALLALAGLAISAGQVSALLNRSMRRSTQSARRFWQRAWKAVPGSILTPPPPASMASTSTATSFAILCTRSIRPYRTVTASMQWMRGAAVRPASSGSMQVHLG